MAIKIETLTLEKTDEATFEGALAAVSELRCEVFREWPYLYEGNPDYERDYLAEFANSPGAAIILARDDDHYIGAATAAPLMSHTSAFAPLYREHGFNPDRVFYLGESVLKKTYRGQGIGHRFFDAREAVAYEARRSDGRPYTTASFCGVVRDSNDARRPADYRPLDGFWEKRGYRKVPGMVGTYDWKEQGAQEEVAHPMQFWVRSLGEERPVA